MDDSGGSGVIIIGITSRPDLIDTSLIRPGRLDLLVYVESPDERARHEIIGKLTSEMPLSNDVNLAEIATKTKGFSGADLVALCREAAINAMRNKERHVSNLDFEKSLQFIKPSITKDVEDWYESIRRNLTYAIPKPMDKAFYS
jgi:transitional endoplasmic reticulum ATPase